MSKYNVSVEGKSYSVTHQTEDVRNLMEGHVDINNLVFWGLPDIVLEKYKSKGIEKMFDWQVECLHNKKVLESGTNLIYTAPTSSGKTLVAEILALKTIFERNKKVLFILPFISIVREKTFYFQDILECSGFRADGIMGSYNPPGGFNALHLAICTIEKANALINRLLEENKLSDIGAVLVDEIHLLGDSSRGYLLELLLTKLRYASIKAADIHIQIIAMSASLPNLNEIAKWLEAECYSTTYRPIPLYEQIVIDNVIYDKHFEVIRNLETLDNHKLGLDVAEAKIENVLQLCLETLRDSHSVLIFCPTKNWCEQLAHQLAHALFKIGNSQTSEGDMLRNQLQSNAIYDILEQLRYCPVGLDQILNRTVSFGVGFHHAGLTIDERDIIERGFRNGGIRILIATSTLSSGVNLPARRVIIRSPIFNGKSIDTLSYHQMIGRAGRLGQDSVGESFIICQKNQCDIVEQLVLNTDSAIQSCLEWSGKLKRAIIEVIASGAVSTQEDLKLFISCTLLAKSNAADVSLGRLMDESVEFLAANEFIRLIDANNGAKKYIATSLGKACLSSSMGPEEALTLLTELDKARQCFVLDSELHLIYLVTPYSSCNSWNIDWMLFLDLWSKLSPAMRRVGELVGVKEYFIIQATRGRITNDVYANHILMVHKRFFVSLALQDLVNEMLLAEVCSKFNCNRGMLQSLQQSAATFAGMVTSFSRQLKWFSVEILLSQFQTRLQFGISHDLLDLMRLSSMHSRTARILHNAGIEGLIDLANADLATLENILYKAVPFESSKDNEVGTESDKNKNCKKLIWIIGREGLTEIEVAHFLIQEARNFLKLEIGLNHGKWEMGTNKKLNLVTKESIHTLNCSETNFTLKSLISTKSTNSADNMPVYLNETQSLSKFNNFVQDKSLDIFSQTIKKSIQENQQAKFSELSVPINDFLEHNITEATLLLSLNDQRENCFNENNLNQNRSSFSFAVKSETVKAGNTVETDTSEQFVESRDIFSLPVKEQYEIDLSSIQNKSIRSNSLSNESNSSVTDTISSKRLKLLEGTRVIYTTKEVSQQALSKDSSLNCSKINVVHVTSKDNLLASFFCELKSKKNFSLVIIYSDVDNSPKIGGNLLREETDLNASQKYSLLSYNGKQIDGMTICWGTNDIYYLSTKNRKMCRKITILLQDIINNGNTTMIMFDVKDQIKYLKSCLNIDVCCKIDDTKILYWLEDTGKHEKCLWKMAKIYCAELIDLVELAEKNEMEPQVKASIESLINWNLVKCLRKVIEGRISRNITNSYLFPSYDLETKIALCLSNMEMNGITVSKLYLKNVCNLLTKQQHLIEKAAAFLIGKKLNFNSFSDVTKALRVCINKKQSIKKHILEHKKKPVAELILQWRKNHYTLTRIVMPLLRFSENNKIYSSYTISTVTGRITMQDPNIQMVPRTFTTTNPFTKELIEVNCRRAFKASEKCLFISADYCQLELRILTYLSQDKLLLSIMNEPGDIFKSIAAKWNDVSENTVDDNLRHRTKQLCYSIIYGRGVKSLSEELEIEATEAADFIESFKNTYVGIKEYICKIIESCVKNGYVETISGRRRYLPSITHENLFLKNLELKEFRKIWLESFSSDAAQATGRYFILITFCIKGDL